MFLYRYKSGVTGIEWKNGIVSASEMSETAYHMCVELFVNAIIGVFNVLSLPLNYRFVLRNVHSPFRLCVETVKIIYWSNDAHSTSELAE